MTIEKYLKTHDLDAKFVKEQLGWAWNDTQISIPVYNQAGELLYNKVRNLDFEAQKEAGGKATKFYFDPPGGHPTLYCLHYNVEKSDIVMCEGEPDCARLLQAQIPAVTSTGGVAKFDEAMALQLKGKRIFICLDTDARGQENVMKVARKLAEVGVTDVKIVELPEESKDVCEFFASGHQSTDFQRLMAEAVTPGEWWQVHQPEDFALRSVKEMLTTEFPPNKWLIDRLIPTEGLCFLVAGEGAWKTFLGLSMALAVSKGESWLGEFGVPLPAKVLFIDKENPHSMIQDRIKGLGFTEELEKSLYWVKRPEKLQLIDERGEPSEFMLSLSDSVRDLEIDWILIDSFVDLMVGDENAAGQTQAFFEVLNRCFPNKSIGILHHENKPSQGTFRNTAQRTRGSSNINAQASTMFRLELVPTDNKQVTIEQTKARNTLKLKKFLVEAQIEELEGGETVVKGFEYKGEVLDEVNKVEEAKTAIEEMLAIATAFAMNRKDILEKSKEVGCSQRTVEKALLELAKDGIISKKKDPQNKKQVVYYLEKFDINEDGFEK